MLAGSHRSQTMGGLQFSPGGVALVSVGGTGQSTAPTALTSRQSTSGRVTTLGAVECSCSTTAPESLSTTRNLMATNGAALDAVGVEEGR